MITWNRLLIRKAKRIGLLLLAAVGVVGMFAPEAEAYYDPVQGRFKQLDPIGYKDGWNLYEYVNSHPTRNVDPTGTIPFNQDSVKELELEWEIYWNALEKWHTVDRGVCHEYYVEDISVLDEPSLIRLWGTCPTRDEVFSYFSDEAESDWDEPLQISSGCPAACECVDLVEVAPVKLRKSYVVLETRWWGRIAIPPGVEFTAFPIVGRTPNGPCTMGVWLLVETVYSDYAGTCRPPEPQPPGS